MGMTINPAVSGGRRRWLGHTIAFLAGVAFGGLVALAVVLALVGVARHVLPLHWLAIGAGAVILWAVLHDLGLPMPLPYRDQQVPEWLRDVLPQSVVAAAFGSMLGLGFLTLFTYSTHLAVLLALPFLGSTSAMFATVATFAVGKTLVLAGAVGTRSLDDLHVSWSSTRIAVLRAATAASSLMIAVLLVGHRLA